MAPTMPALERGDMVWVEFDPAFGHEQTGRRPALVISSAEYNLKSSMVLVCPISRSTREWPFNVLMRDAGPLTGSVLVDQVKSIDKRRVVSAAIGQIGSPGLAEVHGKLGSILGIGLDENTTRSAKA